MRNELLKLKQREQELLAELSNYSAEAEVMFTALRNLMAKRKEAFENVEAVQGAMNQAMEIGAGDILQDIRDGKVGLVDVETGEPIPVTLFHKR